MIFALPLSITPACRVITIRSLPETNPGLKPPPSGDRLAREMRSNIFRTVSSGDAGRGLK
jgi:hypothetical protein